MIRSEQQNKMKFTLFAAILFSVGWMSAVVADDGRPVPCCLTVSNTRPRFENIVRYTIQNQPLCKIRALRFHTKENKVICSDPNDSWAKRGMRIVDDRVTTKPPQKPTMCNTRTTNMIPTVTTTNKTPGTKTETSTRTTVPSTVTTIKISRLETEISKTTIQPTSVSLDNPESTVITCGTDETTSQPTETKRKTFGTMDNTATTTRVTSTTKKKKLSKMMKRKKGKSKKGLQKIQMGNKTG